jgi:hypothetical protein
MSIGRTRRFHGSPAGRSRRLLHRPAGRGRAAGRRLGPAAAPRAPRRGPDGGGRRHWRPVDPGTGHRGADGLRRGRGAHGAGSSAARRRPARRLGPGPSRRARARQRPVRPGHGQAGRARAELFQRHRPDRLLRGGTGARHRQPRRAGGDGPHRARPGPPAGGAHGGWLCLPHRPAPAARSRRHPGGAVHPRRRALLRGAGPELGTRRHDQGAPHRRRPGGGRAFLRRLAPFIWRRNLDFAAIDDIQSIKRQIHAHKGHAEIASRATMSSWAAAASARSSSSPRRSN